MTLRNLILHSMKIPGYIFDKLPLLPGDIKTIVRGTATNAINWVNHSSIFSDMKPFEVIYTLVVLLHLIKLVSFLFHNCRW